MLTDSELEKVRQYLGYPVRGGYPQMIRDRVFEVQSVAPAAIATLQQLIVDLDRISNEIREAAPYLGRSFQSGGTSTAQYFRGEREASLKREGRRLVNLLAETLSLNVCRDIFAGDLQTGSVVR